ncbi:MAG: BON domain-containing protein [Rhodocyclales bacterium]|nr:BON domain-containing protein [Rhodocyclales bacterium]
MKTRLRTYLLPLVSAMLQLATLPALAQEQSNDTNYSQISSDRRFRELDRNGDGYLSESEAASQAGLAKIFRSVDANRDNRLSREEFAQGQRRLEQQAIADYASDSLTTARIKAALLKDSQVSVLGISVETSAGQVILSGFVDSEKQARRIREIVGQVDGVRKVRDLLVLKD